jgi:FixJ family two-component response regulator
VLSHLNFLAGGRTESSSAVIGDEAPQVHHSARGERIAIVDDEQAMATVTATVLDRAGYSTVAYTSPARFLKAFDANPERIDLLVADVVMPGITGIQLVRKLRETGYDLPILLMTGFGVQSRLQMGGSLGRISFVRKPFTMAQLTQSVRRLLT